MARREETELRRTIAECAMLMAVAARVLETELGQLDQLREAGAMLRERVKGGGEQHGQRDKGRTGRPA